MYVFREGVCVYVWGWGWGCVLTHMGEWREMIKRFPFQMRTSSPERPRPQTRKGNVKPGELKAEAEAARAGNHARAEDGPAGVACTHPQAPHTRAG